MISSGDWPRYQKGHLSHWLNSIQAKTCLTETRLATNLRWCAPNLKLWDQATLQNGKVEIWYPPHCTSLLQWAGLCSTHSAPWLTTNHVQQHSRSPTSIQQLNVPIQWSTHTQVTSHMTCLPINNESSCLLRNKSDEWLRNQKWYNSSISCHPVLPNNHQIFFLQQISSKYYGSLTKFYKNICFEVYCNFVITVAVISSDALLLQANASQQQQDGNN